MKKKEFIAKLAAESSISIRKANTFLSAFVKHVELALQKEGSLQLRGFGIFKIITSKSRIGTDPQTHERMILPEAKKIRFKASKSFKKGIL